TAYLGDVVGEPGDDGLEAGRPGLQLPLALLVLVRQLVQLLQPLDDLVEGEHVRVGGRDRRQQLALVRQVVQEHDLVLAVRRAELAPAQGIPGRDRERLARRYRRARRDADPAAHQRAE